MSEPTPQDVAEDQAWLKLASKNLDLIDINIAGAQLSLRHAGLALGNLMHNLADVELTDGHAGADIQGELDTANRALRNIARIIKLRRQLLESE